MLPKPPHRSFLTRVWCSASSPSISSRWRYNRSVVRRGRRPITREDAYAPQAATSLVPHAGVVLGVLAEHKFALAL